MSLATIEISNLRNIERASLEPSARINLVRGENGSGKSALLEAIFLLGRGRSFRTARLNQMINFNAESLMVVGQAVQVLGHRVPIGIEIGRQKKKSEFPARTRTAAPSWPMRCRSN